METIKGDGFTLKWRGEEVVDDVTERMGLALGEFGLRVEGEAKKELKPGHGVKTGTLRRSIHTAPPDYNWLSDDVEPSSSAPVRGNRFQAAVKTLAGIVVSVGSGLKYALPVHQGHDGFSGYHYITRGLKRAQKNIKNIVEKYALK